LESAKTEHSYCSDGVNIEDIEQTVG
jgi:hypothetical protein